MASSDNKFLPSLNTFVFFIEVVEGLVTQRGMTVLILTVANQNAIRIGDSIVLTVLELSKSRVKVGVEAPGIPVTRHGVDVARGEVTARDETALEPG